MEDHDESDSDEEIFVDPNDENIVLRKVAEYEGQDMDDEDEDDDGEDAEGVSSLFPSSLAAHCELTLCSVYSETEERLPAERGGGGCRRHRRVHEAAGGAQRPRLRGRILPRQQRVHRHWKRRRHGGAVEQVLPPCVPVCARESFPVG